MNELRPLDIRKRLGRERWEVPVEFGPDGWRFDEKIYGPGGNTAQRRILVSADVGFADDGEVWVHASISHRDERVMPSYEDLAMMHHAIWPEGNSYQCFVPPAEHINIRGNALHLWGRLDGERVLPNFGFLGTI